MQYSGYLSKHLYSRIANNYQNTVIKTPLDEQELIALKKFNIPYQSVISEEGYPIYILDANNLKAIFCN